MQPSNQLLTIALALHHIFVASIQGMSSLMLRSLLFATEALRLHRWFLAACNTAARPPPPQLAGLFPLAAAAAAAQQMQQTSRLESLLQDCIWFAVPKSKITRHKKRLKTTVQKRIKLRQDIVTDPRTGEMTLQHRMPFNWKDYLPKTDP